MRKQLSFAGIVLALALSACAGTSGDKGQDGSTGPTGPTGPIGRPLPSTAWRFAIMGDTQWPAAGDDGKNPNGVAVDIINQVNKELVEKDVRLVIQVGDLGDPNCADGVPCPSLQTRALFAQALYDAGIAFYPLRGNHESNKQGGVEVRRLFPQTQTGVNNQTPADTFAIPLTRLVGGVATEDQVARPVSAGVPFTVGVNFTSPSDNLKGLTYAFDYGNARFVLLDQFTPPDGAANSIAAQQAWITSTLHGRPAGTHAFVFGHKGLITDNHKDTLFGASAGDATAGVPEATDAFIKSLSDNGVRFYVGGHDHMHMNEVVATTDGATAKVHELVAASESYKFYTPYDHSQEPAYVTRQTRIAESLWEVGFYIVTVDGDNATFEYFAVPVPTTRVVVPYSDGAGGNTDLNITTAPALTGLFQRKDSWGYSLAGKEFLVAQGDAYTVVQDAFQGTTAKILAGMNGSTLSDPCGHVPFTKAVDTGWDAKTSETDSAILSLWGLEDIGTAFTDTYVLSLSFAGATAAEMASGEMGVATQDAYGNWVDATWYNAGGTSRFVAGPWTVGAQLGDHGVDPATNTAWAVVNRGGTFAVATFR